MASAAMATGTSGGKEEEDIETWLENAENIAKIVNLTNTELLRIALLGSRDEAQIWALRSARHSPELT